MLRGSVAVVLVGAALLAAFVLVEARTPRPLVPFSFFTDRARAVANAATVPLSAGLAHLPFCGALLVAIAVVARPIAAFGTTNTALLGLLLTAAGLGRLARLPGHGDLWTDVVPGMLGVATGMGIGLVALGPAVLGTAVGVAVSGRRRR